MHESILKRKKKNGGINPSLSFCLLCKRSCWMSLLYILLGELNNCLWHFLHRPNSMHRRQRQTLWSCRCGRREEKLGWRRTGFHFPRSQVIELNSQCAWNFLSTSVETTAVSQCYDIVNSWQYTLGCMFSEPSKRKIYVRAVFLFLCIVSVSQKINAIITAVITSLE